MSLEGSTRCKRMKWDSELYDGEHGFVAEYGKGLLDYLPAGRPQVILDLGCGTGVLTKELSKHGDVIGLDSSADMIEKARASYPELRFACGDACRLEWKEYFDVIFSNAVFHWIKDQESLLEGVYNALKPGGMLICEFGAKGNIGAIMRAFEKAMESHGYSYKEPFYFPLAAEYKELLKGKGFSVDIIFDFDRPTELKDGRDGLRNWMKMFFADGLASIKQDESEIILSEVERDLEPVLWNGEYWTADYRRLRVIAKK